MRIVVTDDVGFKGASAVVLAIFSLIGLVALVGEFRMPLSGDVAYNIDAARRMLGDAVLYHDLIDVKPPFIFWLSAPVAALGLDGPATIAAFRIFVLLVMLASVAVAWPAVRNAPSMLAGFLLIAAVLPIGYYGQREHLLFILTFPYLAFVAMRIESGESSRVPLHALAGALAALGFALKPTAGVVAVLVILWHLRIARSWRPLLAPEHLGLMAGTAVAAIAALLIAPQYLDVIAAIREPYRAFNRLPLAELLARDVHMWSVWFALGTALLFRRSIRARRRALVYGLATAGFFASAVAQGKGFGYHYYPAVGWSVILLVKLLTGRSRKSSRIGLLRRCAAALALLPVVYLFGAVALRRIGGVVTNTSLEQRVVSRLAGPEPTDLAVLSARISDAFPMVLEGGHHFVLRYPLLWAAALPAHQPGTAAIRRQYGYDLAQYRPAVLIVRRPVEGWLGRGDVAANYLDYLCLDTVARRVLAEYRLAERADGFELYRLDAKGDPACASS